MRIVGDQGQTEIILSGTYLVPIGERLKLEIPDPDGDEVLHLEIDFPITDPDDYEVDVSSDGTKKKRKPNPSISMHGEGDKGFLRFHDWIDTFGHNTSKPIRIGSTEDGHDLTFLATAIKKGSIFQLVLQVSVEVKDD